MTIRIAAPLALAAALALPASPALAQNDEPITMVETPSPMLARANDIVAVLKDGKPATEVFSARFLAAVPEAQLATLLTQMEGQFGPLQKLENVEGVAPGRSNIVLRFERALVGGPFAVDAEGKVDALLLNDIRPLAGSEAELKAQIEALPGEVSVFFAPLDASQPPLLSIKAEQQMAIGSAFKLYVLSALAREIESGARNWNDVVALDTRSLPSGMMHNWPQGAPVTLHTLATMMISISDNSATDQLIHTLGRAKINQEVRVSGHSAPDRILPFLTTLELFALKGDTALGEEYAALGEDAQGARLEALAQTIARDPQNITPPRFTAPTAIDSLEWFANGEDLRKLLSRIVALEDPTARQILAVDPALPPASGGDWRYAGFKGGSEPGVLNLTWLLQDKAGAWHMLAMSWNDPAAPVDEKAFELLALRVLALAKERP